MERREAMALIGRKVRLFNRLGHPTAVSYTLVRYDVSRRRFLTRNLHTSQESPITVAELSDGIASHTLQIEDRKGN